MKDAHQSTIDVIPVREDIEIEHEAVVSASVMVIWFVVFVGDASRGILFPLLWTLCDELSGSTVDLGYLVAIYSFGRIIVTTPLGYLSDQYKHRFPLILASVVLCIGSLIWANALLTSNLYILYFAQFIMGCGSGSLGVTRSYIVEQTPQEYRTSTLAVLNGIQYAGFTVSPMIGSILGSSIGQKINRYWMFALPSYFLSFLCVISTVSLYFTFKNIDETHSDQKILDGRILSIFSSALTNASSSSSSSRGSSSRSLRSSGDSSLYTNCPVECPPQTAAAGPKTHGPYMSLPTAATANDAAISGTNKQSQQLDSNSDADIQMLTARTASFSDSNVQRHMLQTQAVIDDEEEEEEEESKYDSHTPLLDQSPSQSQSQSSSSQVIKVSESESESAAAAAAANRSMCNQSHVQVQVSVYMYLILIAMILLHVATKGSISVYETLGAQIGTSRYALSTSVIGALVTTSGLVGFLQLLFFKSCWAALCWEDSSLIRLGIAIMIAAQLVSITNLIHVNVVSYVISIALVYAFGYPIAHTAVLGAFSKIQRSGPQGTLLGLFATAGSLSRICMPIIAVYLEEIGMDVPFCLVLFVLSIAYISYVLLGPTIEWYCSHSHSSTHGSSSSSSNSSQNELYVADGHTHALAHSVERNIKIQPSSTSQSQQWQQWRLRTWTVSEVCQMAVMAVMAAVALASAAVAVAHSSP